MKSNIGTLDMMMRIVAGLALLYIGFMDNTIISAGLPKTIIGIFAFVPLLTGLARYCPLYAIIGMSTCTKPTNDEPG